VIFSLGLLSKYPGLPPAGDHITTINTTQQVRTTHLCDICEQKIRLTIVKFQYFAFQCCYSATPRQTWWTLDTAGRRRVASYATLMIWTWRYLHCVTHTHSCWTKPSRPISHQYTLISLLHSS